MGSVAIARALKRIGGADIPAATPAAPTDSFSFENGDSFFVSEYEIDEERRGASALE